MRVGAESVVLEHALVGGALDFPDKVHGVDRSAGMAEIMRRQSPFYAAHDDDWVID